MEPVDTTTQKNEHLRTYRDFYGPYRNGQDAFNALSQMPDGPILLGDGRQLNVTRWVADGDESILGGADHLRFTMEGFISLTDEARDNLTAKAKPTGELKNG